MPKVTINEVLNNEYDDDQYVLGPRKGNQFSWSNLHLHLKNSYRYLVLPVLKLSTLGFFRTLCALN